MPKEDHDHASSDQEQDHHAKMAADFRRRFWVSTALSLPIVALSPMIQGLAGLREVLHFTGDSYVQWALATAVFLYGGWPFLTGLVNELKDKQPGMMTLIGLAVGVAYGYSSAVVFGLEGRVFFWELATLIDVMLLGHWLEMKSVMGAGKALESLGELMPSEAHRKTEGGDLEDVPVEELEAGDRVVVKPGETIPIDGSIAEGRTSIDESMLTGESQPVAKGEGDEVVGGSINGESAITIEVQKTGEETYLSQVVTMVREAQESRSRTQDLADRAALWLTIIALTVGVITLTAWLGLGADFVYALERMVTVMVITCPHALGLAIPLVVAVSTSLAASNGLLIRDRSAFEQARNVDAVLFDKTGTLTEGRFGVAKVMSMNGRDDSELLKLAASLESRSEHPIAQGIVAEANARDLDVVSPDNFEAIPGQGARAEVQGSDVKVVSHRYLKENDLTVNHEDVKAAADKGQTVVYILVDDAVAGAIALSDVIRSESHNALQRLRDMGVQTMMITGDNEAVARQVARELDLEDYFAEVPPDQKADKVKEVQGRDLMVAMVGDGINDAPALAQADVGIAIGAGTDVAIESAHIILARSDPRDVVAIMNLARSTHGKMVQNLVWATGYNVVAIPLAAGVLYSFGIVLSPAVGAAVMALSTIIVAFNARLLGRKSHGDVRGTEASKD